MLANDKYDSQIVLIICFLEHYFLERIANIYSKAVSVNHCIDTRGSNRQFLFFIRLLAVYYFYSCTIMHKLVVLF